MAQLQKTLAVIGVLVFMLGLTGCGAATPSAAPTIDLNQHSTEVASTVFAQVTRDLALTPSATVPPTATDTAQATFTSAPTASPGSSLALTPGFGGTPVYLGTPGTGTPVVTTLDRAEWVSQSIADGTRFAPGEAFTITWRLKNVGVTTWTTAYRLRFYSGNRFGAPAELLLGRDVPPGETLDISIPMTAPTTVGDYRTDWVLSSPELINFKQPVFLLISVAIQPTATRTTAPTAAFTPTGTP